MNASTVRSNVEEVSRDFAADRRNRQSRRRLEKADFDRLAGAGFLLTGVPQSMGGLWTDLASSTRPIAEILRVLAQGDPSVALVSAMHPAVLSFWLALTDPPDDSRDAWAEQSRFVAQTALNGDWWGTITSEPGSGGDVARTRTRAVSDTAESYRLTGQKHFGSGSGMASYMITTALPEGETEADWFFMETRDQAWDGSTGMKLISEWDGHGMTATQSHAFDFTDFPAVRFAWPGNLTAISGVVGPLVSALFTAVIVGVTQSAVVAARSQIAKRKDQLQAYEQVEWARIENEAWLVDQAYEGMLRAIEAKGSGAALDALHAKTAVSELAESATSRICRVIGGGTFHRSSQFGAAFEDVRALGFLRPPWVLAYDQLLGRTLEQL